MDASFKTELVQPIAPVSPFVEISGFRRSVRSYCREGTGLAQTGWDNQQSILHV